MNILVVDVGGTHVKVLATGKKEKREFASGPRLTAPLMVSRVRKLAQDWRYQAVSIGYPGPVPLKPTGCGASQPWRRMDGIRHPQPVHLSCGHWRVLLPDWPGFHWVGLLISVMFDTYFHLIIS